MHLGRFASQSIRSEDEQPLGISLCGVRYDRIEVRLTVEDFYSARVNEWLKHALIPRVVNPRDYEVSIRIVPN